MVGGEGAGEAVVVPVGEQAADNGDAEGAASLKKRAIGAPADAGVLAGQRAHHRCSRRGDDEPGADAEQGRAGDDPAVGGGDRGARDLFEPGTNGSAKTMPAPAIGTLIRNTEPH